MTIADYQPGGDLVFASDLSGTAFVLLEDEIYNNDDDDRPDLDADVHGKWLRVETEDSDETFLAAPGELLEELQRLDYEVGAEYTITRCVKSGPKQTDPYEVNAEEISDESQSRLA